MAGNGFATFRLTGQHAPGEEVLYKKHKEDAFRHKNHIFILEAVQVASLNIATAAKAKMRKACSHNRK